MGCCGQGVQCQGESRGSHRLVVEVGRAQQGASLLFLAASCHPRLLPPLRHRFPPAARARSEPGITGKGTRQLARARGTEQHSEQSSVLTQEPGHVSLPPAPRAWPIYGPRVIQPGQMEQHL